MTEISEIRTPEEITEYSFTGGKRYSKGKDKLAFLSPSVWPENSLRRKLSEIFWRVEDVSILAPTLLDPDCQKAVLEILRWAAEDKEIRYPLHNWSLGLPLSNTLSASLRHLNKCEFQNEAGVWVIDTSTVDDESNRSHWWHALCGMMFANHVLTFFAGSELDDRPMELLNAMLAVRAREAGDSNG